MWSQSENFIKNLDTDYTTIASFEYVGDNYPDTSSISEDTTGILDSIDTEKIKNSPYVLNWDDSSQGIAWVGGVKFLNSLSRYSKCGILVVKLEPQNKKNNYVFGYILDTVYCEGNYSGKICYFDLSLINEEITEGNYLVHGEFFLGPNAYPHFKVTPINISNSENNSLNTLLPLVKIEGTSEDFLEQNTEYIELGEKYRRYNNSISIISTSDISALENVHQQKCTLLEGRFFTETEAKSNSHSIIITEYLASAFDIKIGDSINLFAYFKKEGISLKDGFFTEASDINADYSVVGIVSTPMDLRATVYIPKAVSFATSVSGYKLGQATLKNGTTDAFIDSVSSLLPPNLVISIYDQGYKTAYATLSALSKIGMIITIVSIVVGAVFLALFAFLFVGKQKDTLTIMDSLGSGKKSLFGYVLSGSGLIIAPAAIIAGTLSYILFGVLFEKFFTYIQSLYSYNLNFSSARLGIQHPFVLNFEVNPLSIFITCICVILAALIFSALMLAFLKTNPFKNYKEKKKKTVKHIRVKHSFTHISGALKYSVISITRGKAKGIVVAVVSLVVVVFFSVLNIVTTNYNDKLNGVIKNTQLEVIATDSNGKGVGNLVIGADILAKIYNTGYVSIPNISWETNYLYGGVYEYSDGTKGELIEHQVPSSSFSYESFLLRLAHEPKSIFTNNIKKSPEFYYSNEIQMEFLDGYDATSLGRQTNLCVVPYSFAESKGITFGDTIRLYNLDKVEKEFIIADYKVVGMFNKINKNESIYCSFENFKNLDGLLDDNYSDYRVTLKSASFTLNDASNLDDFKQALSDLHISQVGKFDFNRVVIQIQDKEFLDTVSNLNQTLRYLKFIYGAMFLLAVIIGFLVSYLLTVSRKSELAVMRSVGTGRIRVFLSFFIEQSLMCVLGALIGFLGMLLFTSATLLQGLSILAFVIIYLSGSALSIALMMRISVMEILAQKE